MAHIVIMPRQGNTVESCVIVGWNKKEGDAVKADSPLCDVETDKATFEVVAGAEGILLKILHNAGDDVPVLEPIAVIGNAGEDWQAALGATGPVAASMPAASMPAASMSAASMSAASLPAASMPAASMPAASAGAGYASAAASPAERAVFAEMPVSPRARNLAARAAADLSGVAGTGPGGRIIERDVQAVLESRPALTAAARAALSSEGALAANLAGTGSGIGGRFRAADLGATGEPETGAAVLSAPPQTDAAESPEQTETHIKGIRKIISDRMLQSLSTTAQYTLNIHARADRLQDLRQRFKASNPDLGLSGITINDIILFAVSRILPHYSFMNAHKIEDRLITYRPVHLGTAVDTERGLMVPVIRNANQLSLAQIAAEAKRLAAACQNGTITADELTGSTFTVTNLGSLGIESFTPLINIPEVAILGVCGIDLKPVQDDSPSGVADKANAVRFVPHIGLSLTINHQVVDGAPAARFLKALCESLAQIDLWLAR